MKKPLYNSLLEWKKAEPFACQSAYNKGMIEMICEKFGWKKHRRTSWTLEQCKEVALKYSFRKAFQIKQGTAYQTARKNGWLDECCEHMVEINKPFGYWTLERCKEVALKCSSRSKFGKKYSTAYQVARKNGCLDEYCGHMNEGNRYKGFWTLERCKEFALKCKTKKEFRTKYSSAYTVALRSNCINECCNHMIAHNKPNGYWTLERCKEVALQFKTKKEFRIKHGGAYEIAKRNNWLDECYNHITDGNKQTGYWTLERCKKVALKCSSRSKFGKKHGGAYEKCKRKKWLEECCAHMKK